MDQINMRAEREARKPLLPTPGSRLDNEEPKKSRSFGGTSVGGHYSGGFKPQRVENWNQSHQSTDKPNILKTQTESVNLHRAEIPWKARRKPSAETFLDENALTLEVYKKVRGVLNKLTPEEFSALAEQLWDLPIDTEERLKGVVDLVFEKAVSEPQFSRVYARMCRNLALISVRSDQNDGNVNFRNLLLVKCQKEFERDEIRKAEDLLFLADQDKRIHLTDEQETNSRKTSIRSLGNIKLVGALHNNHMLVTTVVHNILKKLLVDRDENSLECLCMLLIAVGKKLDSEKSLENPEKRAQRKALMEKYFDGLKEIVESGSTSFRIKFRILHVIELRQNNWVSRRIPETPKPLGLVRHEALLERYNQYLTKVKLLGPKFADKKLDETERKKNSDQRKVLCQATFILDDYLHCNDFKIAIQRIVTTPIIMELLDIFVSVSVTYVLDRSRKARLGLGHLLRVLLSRGKLSQNQLLQGLELVFEAAEDLVIDIPKMWEYLAEILLPLMQAGSLGLKELRVGVPTCIEKNYGGKLFSSLLHVITEQLGHKKAKELWTNSGIEWSDILGPDEDLAEFVIANDLVFTTTNDPPVPESKFSTEHLEQGLDALFKDYSSNEIIFDWIEAKLSDDKRSGSIFICALTTSITKEALVGGIPKKFNSKKLEDRIVLLKKYVNGVVDLEVQVLDTLQTLHNSLQLPKGLLIRIFELLYDEEVISKDAFTKWENNRYWIRSEGKQGAHLRRI